MGSARGRTSVCRAPSPRPALLPRHLLPWLLLLLHLAWGIAADENESLTVSFIQHKHNAINHTQRRTNELKNDALFNVGKKEYPEIEDETTPEEITADTTSIVTDLATDLTDTTNDYSPSDSTTVTVTTTYSKETTTDPSTTDSTSTVSTSDPIETRTADESTTASTTDLTGTTSDASSTDSTTILTVSSTDPTEITIDSSTTYSTATVSASTTDLIETTTDSSTTDSTTDPTESTTDSTTAVSVSTTDPTETTTDSSTTDSTTDPTESTTDSTTAESVSTTESTETTTESSTTDSTTPGSVSTTDPTGTTIDSTTTVSVSTTDITDTTTDASTSESTAGSSTSQITSEPTTTEETTAESSTSETISSTDTTYSTTPDSTEPTATTEDPDGPLVGSVFPSEGANPCIFAKMRIVLDVPYMNVNNEARVQRVEVPRYASASGQCSAEVQELAFSWAWPPGGRQGARRWERAAAGDSQVSFVWKLSADNATFALFSMAMAVVKTNTVIGDLHPDEEGKAVREEAKDLELFKAPVGQAHACTAAHKQALDGGEGGGAAITLSDVELMAFNEENNDLASATAVDCDPGASGGGVNLYIVIGASVAAAVIVVAIVYTMYQRRSRNRFSYSPQDPPYYREHYA